MANRKTVEAAVEELGIDTLRARFATKHRPDPETGCWRWTGWTDRNGYGRMRVGRTAWGAVTAHRLSFLLHVRKPKEGEYVLHKCGNRWCVNPEHLYAGTHEDNMRDMVAHGTSTRGSKHPLSKLTDDAVLEIRRMYARKMRIIDIAAQFQLRKSTIHAIVHRKTWTHL
jgi:hypothetical protein